jgi:hypothetical protein
MLLRFWPRTSVRLFKGRSSDAHVAQPGSRADLREKPRRPLTSTLGVSVKKRSGTDLHARLAVFVKQYARKAQRGIEPNDRAYDAKLEKLMKSLPPEELSKLLSDDEPNEN